MGNLATNKVYAWTPDKFKLSEIFQTCYANFANNGDPNGAGVPKWPAANAGGPVQLLRLEVTTRVEPEQHSDRYLFLDQFYAKP